VKTIALIPARAGSRRLLNKNIIDLGGKPLIAWTLDVAHRAKLFDTVAVSTDSPQIATIASQYEDTLVLERPTYLAKDDTPMLDVVRHVAELQHEFDAIFLLQPTSPFRTEADILAAYDMLKHSQGDAVVSVTDGPCDLVFQVGHANRMRSRTDMVVANGAIYGITMSALFSGEDWYSGISYAYYMPKDRSLDIDTEGDLEIARAMIASRGFR
jgi:CMP-N,N'-diacetyllegionaminic acid synthase